MGEIPRPPSPVRLTTDALNWALKHLRRFGDTVFVPRAFEYEAIQHDWKTVRTWLAAQDMREWAPRPYRRFLAAKTKGSFRYVTQLDPLEHLAFAGLVYDLGQELETFRIPTTENTVFAWRFSPRSDGTMYDPQFRWHAFNERCRSLAEKRSIKHVVVADIADFFPHLYLHPLERVLERCTATRAQAYCVLRMLKGWNARVSYGVPVGPPSSRILADTTLTDLDKALIGDGATYCRYSDDFRIFCRTKAEARTRLESLAEHLFESYGLTLQSSKTLIIPKQEYIERFSLTAERLQSESLEERFRELLEQTGWEPEYDDDDVEYDDLPDEVQEEIDKLNLSQLLRDQLAGDRYDPIVVATLLRWLGQIDDDSVVSDVLRALDDLEPVIHSVVRYFSALRSVSSAARRRIGRRILKGVRRKGAGRYQVACLLSTFTHGREFDNEDEFESLYDRLGSAASRELTLALGRAGKGYWFVARRRGAASLDPWLRRAFLAGASCMESDVRRAFFKSEERTGDVLEKAILTWVKAHPF